MSATAETAAPPLAPAGAWKSLPVRWQNAELGPGGAWLAYDAPLAWVRSPLVTVLFVAGGAFVGYVGVRSFGLTGVMVVVVMLGSLLAARVTLWVVRRALDLALAARRRREADRFWPQAVADPASAPVQALLLLALVRAGLPMRDAPGGLFSRFIKAGYTAASYEARCAEVGLGRPRTIVQSRSLVPAEEDRPDEPPPFEPESLGGTGDRRGWRAVAIGATYIVLGVATFTIIGRIGWLLIGVGGFLALTGLLRATGTRAVELQTDFIAPGRVATAGAVRTVETTCRESVAVVQGSRAGLTATFVGPTSVRMALVFGSPRDERYLRWWRAWHAPGEPAPPINEAAATRAEAKPE